MGGRVRIGHPRGPMPVLSAARGARRRQRGRRVGSRRGSGGIGRGIDTILHEELADVISGERPPIRREGLVQVGERGLVPLLVRRSLSRDALLWAFSSSFSERTRQRRRTL